MKSTLRIMRIASLLTQLGISLVAPPLLLVWLSLHLQTKYGIGPWLTVVAICVGLISAFCSAWQLLKKVLRQNDKNDDPPPVSFDRHL